ncbi:MAG: DNA cytosine methyltransferase [Phycisphaerales bacterium]|nr:DNA cytosine methyltransferase [Phycisphaerales bacterium]
MEAAMPHRRSLNESKRSSDRKWGVSLFCGSGIGDLGFRAAGIQFLAMCEIDPDRSALAALNFPEATHYPSDVSEAADQIVRDVEERLDGDELWLVSCTAPCQGMSKNGQGTLLRNARAGKRPSLDPRNRLILPGLDIICRLRPRWVVFENVVEMQNTVIEDRKGQLRLIVDIIREELADDYVGSPYVIEVADYGVPQRRQRLISVFTRDETASARFRAGTLLVPSPTHSRVPRHGRAKWTSVSEALADFPPLDAKSPERAEHASIPFHRVPVLEPKKYEWVRHTPAGASAFDNQCVSPGCGHDSNRNHGASRNNEGINQAHKTTPLYCEKCGSLLPRPYAEDPDGKIRIMSGFTSAYKRMSADLPAPTLTRNLSYACSDQKLHPTQNRVLSLAEAMKLQTISDYHYSWGPIEITSVRGKRRISVAPDSIIRLVIGESVPPRFLHQLGDWMSAISNPESSIKPSLPDTLVPQLALFDGK